MKHTKGKWEQTAKDIVVKDDKGGQFRICTLIKHIKDAQIEDKANARLIAAAPALLEACEKIEKKSKFKGQNLHELARLIAELEGIAKAAIAMTQND